MDQVVVLVVVLVSFLMVVVVLELLIKVMQEVRLISQRITAVVEVVRPPLVKLQMSVEMEVEMGELEYLHP
jgi:hypothetical protein